MQRSASDATQRIRPLFIISDLEMGGAQRVILTVLRYLKRNGICPELALVSEKGPLSGELPEDIHVYRLKAGRVRYAILKILKLCWASRPDAVISTVGHLNILLSLIKPLLPRNMAVIVREANTPSIRLLHTRHPHLYGLAYRTLYPLCTGLVCNCGFMKMDISSHFGFPPERIAVIPNPVDTERISRHVLSAENPYTDGDVQIASVGRMEHQKGFDLLLKAFQKGRQVIPNLHLTLVGDGPKREPLQRLAGELGISAAVSFVGQKRNPYPYMAHADFVVSSSRWEGSPNTVLESLACGTPVLAFDCPGGTGEIISEGENGWLVPAEDWLRMGERMVEIVSGTSWSGMKGGRLLPNKYSCENVVAQWEALFRGVVAQQRHKGISG